MKKYNKGLVLGKFMPITKGHEALIDYASTLCEEVVVLVCYTSNEPIPGEERYRFVREIYRTNQQIIPIPLTFDERDLSSSSVAAKSISLEWANHIKEFVPEVDVIISSEPYGELVAQYMGISNETYDLSRTKINISATQVRENPYHHWDMISQPVRDYFFKKVILLGTESTGKSTLSKNLAQHFNSSYVHEAGRDIVPDTRLCTKEDLMNVAKIHSKNIIIAEQSRNKMLFIDTDINITKSYYSYLFKDDMKLDGWMKLANKADLYIYLEPDAPYVQDGTRLSERERLILDTSHKNQIAMQGIQYFSVYGKDWKQREEMALEIIYREILLRNTVNKLDI
jgi:HTH-type transcriptional repressor of NAD biosynthesis genes